MTADELRKLAEIAGIKLIDTGFNYSSDFAYGSTQYLASVDWKPHLSIEQAMMVADTFVEWELRKTSEKRYYSFVVSDDLENYYDATEDTASLSLCRAALAAKE